MLEIWDKQLFELTRSRAVALTFSDVRPDGLAREKIPQPSACAFWKLAAEGKVFYTEASDHFGCSVGAYTLGAELTEVQKHELGEAISTMVNLSYLTEQEVADLPRRDTPLRYTIYAPLGLSPAFPDVVLVRANVRQLMLLTEAARSAGCFKASESMGRPACGIVPQSTDSGQVVLSLACVGNRVYTGLGDQEAYLAIPGSALEPICRKIDVIVKANEALATFHMERQNQFVTTA